MTACVLVFGRRQQRGSTRSTHRRPKSAKARSRGKLGSGQAAGATRIQSVAAAGTSAAVEVTGNNQQDGRRREACRHEEAAAPAFDTS
jgi:hypothetical protein